MGSFDWGPLLAGGGPFYIGILNLTPDSFSDGGRFQEPSSALAQARRLAAAGARMLDLGAESTRPGADAIAEDEEWDRLRPVLELLRRELPALPLSVDTRHAAVAGRALAAGAAVLNDVTGFGDDRMLELARHEACGLIAMRSRQRAGGLWMPPYGEAGEASADAAIAELGALRDRLRAAGLAADRVLLDPGFGFGTTYEEDSALWGALGTLPARLGWPAGRFCIGISRKRFSAWKAGQPELPPDQRDRLGAQLHAQAQAFGYRVFRTHAL